VAGRPAVRGGLFWKEIQVFSFQFSAGPDPNVFPETRNRWLLLLTAENLTLKTENFLLRNYLL